MNFLNITSWIHILYLIKFVSFQNNNNTSCITGDITLNRNWLSFKTCFEFLLFALLAKKLKVVLYFYDPYSHGFLIILMNCLLHQIWMLIRQVCWHCFTVRLIWYIVFVWFFSSDALFFQVYRYLDFLASLLEHPRAKVSIFFPDLCCSPTLLFSKEAFIF